MDKQKLIELIDKGYNRRVIAEHLGCSKSTIAYWLTKYELKTKSNGRHQTKKSSAPGNCKWCKKSYKSGASLVQHEIRCKQNPEQIDMSYLSDPEEIKKRTESGFGWANLTFEQRQAQWTPERKKAWSQKMKEECRGWSDPNWWTKERRQKHSEVMQRVVRENPESYSNIGKRTKPQEYKGQKFDSGWEVLVAKWLDQNGISWNRDIDPIDYIFEGKEKLYYPDFFLPQHNLYIEVKGYNRLKKRNEAKWSVVENLILIQGAEIKQIKKGMSFETFLSCVKTN